jgi:hypothetical protein
MTSVSMRSVSIAKKDRNAVHMRMVLYLCMQMNGRLKMKKKLKMKMKIKIGDPTAPRIASATPVYDTEVHCEKCGTRLYVSPEGATFVLASLRSVGMAGLVCLCGHTQLIDASLRPRVLPMQKRRHD